MTDFDLSLGFAKIVNGKRVDARDLTPSFGEEQGRSGAFDARTQELSTSTMRDLTTPIIPPTPSFLPVEEPNSTPPLSEFMKVFGVTPEEK